MAYVLSHTSLDLILGKLSGHMGKILNHENFSSGQILLTMSNTNLVNVHCTMPCAVSICLHKFIDDIRRGYTQVKCRSINHQQVASP